MEDWNKLTVNQLKAECTKRSLDITGKKADLVQRLTEYVAENEEEENGEEEVEQVAEDDEVAEGDEEAEEAEPEEEAVVEEAEEEAADDGDAQEEEEEEAEEGEDGGESVDKVIDAIDSVMEEEAKKEEEDEDEKKEKADEKAKLKKATSRPKIPTKKVVRTEIQEEQRVRTVVFGPLSLSDLKNEEMVEFLGQADQFFIRFTTDGSSGHAQLRMKTFEEAQGLVEAMTENPFKEGLVIKQLGPEDGQNVDAILKGEPEKSQEKFDVRMLYIHHVPESATEDALKQLLPEALSACIPRDEKRKSKGYAYLEFEDSEKMEACYKTVDTLTLDGYLMTLHHIPQYEHQKYSTPNRPPMNKPNFNNRGGRRPDGRGNYQNRDRRPDNRHQGGRQGYGGGGGNRNWGGNVRPLLGNQPSNWGNQGNQGGSGGVDAVNLLVGLSQMLSNQQGGGGGGGQGNQNFGGGGGGHGNQGFRQGGYGNRQGGSQDQWNRKRRANDGGGMGYGKMQRRDNYGGGGGYNQGRRY